jgi:hypothetical protein
MQSLEERYHELVSFPCDINEHLPTLYEYGKRCKHITEFGVRDGVSTMAWLCAHPDRLVCYDLVLSSTVSLAFEEAKDRGEKYDYIQANVLDTWIEDTDLLFIDTFHCERQLVKELKLHADRVRKYIIFHDVETYGWIGEDGGVGILRPIVEFLALRKDWKIDYYSRKNNGLMVIERCSL